MTEEQREFKGEKIVLKTNSTEASGHSTTEKKKKWHVGTDLIPFTKINSKWVIGLNVKHKAIKLLEDNRGENLVDLERGDTALDTTSKTWPSKT